MTWFIRPEARRWRTAPLADDVAAFHAALPGYAPTPLVDVPALAAELGVGRVFVKDESARLGLPAFKILGASYAIARALSARQGTPDRALPLSALAAAPETALTATTDGNHGRAVAHIARVLGVPVTISVPTGVTAAARNAITAEGATLVELDLPYDAAVGATAAAAGPDTIVVQDTAWPGYVDVPQWIVDGYATLFAEVDRQLTDAGVERLDLVAVPVGVGSLAQAAVRHYRSGTRCPAVLTVEPERAPAVIASLLGGAPTSVPTGRTVMAGLNCGTPSSLAWPVLAAGVDAATTVSEAAATAAVRDLERLGVDSGPCGAAALAGARVALADHDRRATLDLGRDAVVVLLSTEGRAANPLPA
jgi:diaminopropionate ammonia-lyase